MAIKSILKKIFPSFFKSDFEDFESQFDPNANVQAPTHTHFDARPIRRQKITARTFDKHLPLVIILLIALFSADLTILMFRDSLLPTSAPPIFPSKGMLGPNMKSRTEYGPITDRNIFNSDGIIPNPLSAPEGEMMADDGPAVKSKLPLNLIGTIVHVNPGKSVATIQLKTTNMVTPYLPNDQIENMATLIRVQRRKAIIRNLENSHLEYIEIPDDTKVSFAKTAAPATAGVFTQQGDTIAIKRTDLNNYLKNLPDLLQQATAVPNIVPGTGGEVDGFKMLGIEPNSVFSQIGLKVGDVLKSVNGEKVNSPAKAMELYNSLRNEGHIELEIERDGRPTALNFNIND
jgi:general secretion pathway protein C